jgi:hypothetical protein
MSYKLLCVMARQHSVPGHAGQRPTMNVYPCTLARTLKLYPTLTNRNDLSAPLHDRTDLHQHLPPTLPASQLLALVAPTLWPVNSILTLESVAHACLHAMFTAVDNKHHRVGAWLVHATREQRQAVRALQQARNYRSIALGAWWQQFIAQQPVPDVAAAGTALFKNPTVSVCRGGQALRSACMVIHSQRALISWQSDTSGRSYPHLVLQHGGGHGRPPPQVSVPCHVLVAWLFHGPPQSEGLQVCHYDVAPASWQGVQWEQFEYQLASNQHLWPRPARCLSKACVNPLCLHYSTQSDNAATGSTSWQAAGRQGRQGVGDRQV